MSFPLFLWRDVFCSPFSSRAGETPAKVREDLEKSLTELNNLSLSICNSEVSLSASRSSSVEQKTLHAGRKARGRLISTFA